MANKVWVFDMDGTLMHTLDLYRKPIAEACSLIIEILGSKAPSEHEIRIRHNKIQQAMIYEINPQTKKLYLYTKARFPTSLVRIYKILCKEVGLKTDSKIEGRLYAIGFEVFNKKRYPRKILPAVRSSFKFLDARKDILVILTKGDKEVQGDKKEALKKVGILKYCKAFFIVRDEKGKTFKEIRRRFGKDKLYYSVGDTYEDDIVPALKHGYFGIYIPSPFNWKEIGKLSQINRKRDKKRSNKYRDLTEIRRKYEYL